MQVEGNLASRKTSTLELRQEILALRQRVVDLEAQQRSQQAEYDILFDAIPDAVIYTDPARVIHYINPVARQIFGYQSHELIGQDIGILYANPDDYREQGRLRYNADAVPNLEPYEIAYRRQNGTVFWGEAHGTIVRDGTGKHIGNVVIIRDISERKAMERRLFLSQQRLRETQEIVRDLVWSIDAATHTVLYINPAVEQVYGCPTANFYQDAELRYRMVHPDDQKLVQEALRKQAQTGFAEAEYRILRADGQIRWLHERSQLVHDDDGTPLRIDSIATDITSRKLAEQQRLELAVKTERVRLLEDLIGDISHDFKTPLSVIATNLYLIKKHAPADAQKYVDRSEIHLNRLAHLIDDLLTISRLSQDIQLSLVPTHLGMVMEVVFQLKEPLATEKGQTFQVELSPDLPMVLADSQELTRVFNNLLDNAITYTPKGGFVALRGWADEQQVIVEISDTGIGIEPQDLEHIFDRFYRADRARASHTGGTGLGLAIVKKIVQMHQGRIEVESIPGQGSTFRVILPRP
jgi:PAS domain S-box-containing protein